MEAARTVEEVALQPTGVSEQGSMLGNLGLLVGTSPGAHRSSFQPWLGLEILERAPGPKPCLSVYSNANFQGLIFEPFLNFLGSHIERNGLTSW